MELLMNVDTALSLKYSPRKIDMEIEKGIDMISAMNEVRSVPARNGRAPNRSDEASHVFPAKKPAPKVFIDGIDVTRSVKKIASNIATTVSADR
jgi:hypothetical protein